MSDTLLVAETGRPTGSAASRRLRAEDKIPAIVYGQGMEPLSVTVDRRELRQALSGPAGLNTVLDLSVDGTVYPAIVKDLQRHPVRRSVDHIDFIQISLTAEIVVSIPLRLVGEATAVMNDNGLVDPAVDTIEVTTTPRLIPDEIVIDISEMTMDSVIRLSDVEFPEGVVATGDPDSPVVTVLVMRAEPEPEDDAEAVEGDEVAADGDEAGGDTDTAADEPADD